MHSKSHNGARQADHYQTQMGDRLGRQALHRPLGLSETILVGSGVSYATHQTEQLS
jgi:hypothetical protein